MAPIFTGSKFGFGGGAEVAVPFSATGGTVTAAGITPGNGYRYHVFTAPGTFTVNSGFQVGEVLIVAGGGGGGAIFDGVGGGGGAGGVVYYTTYSFTSPIPITVGSGGPGGPSQPNGGNTVFGSTTALGGAIGSQSRRGTIYGPPTGNPGGSGGGGNGFDSPRPGGTATQPGQTLVPGSGGTNYGTAGGNGGNTYGGGGGGSGGAGNNSPPSVGGSGGNGQPFPGFMGPLISPEIPAPNVPVIGPLGYYAGGGAGANNGSGGTGGGGAGGNPGGGASATGYGSGGGGSWTGPLTNGGSGSPGIVIIRYLT